MAVKRHGSGSLSLSPTAISSSMAPAKTHVHAACHKHQAPEEASRVKGTRERGGSTLSSDATLRPPPGPTRLSHSQSRLVQQNFD